MARPKTFDVKDARAIQKKFMPPRFARGLSNLIRLFTFLLGSNLGKTENIFIFFVFCSSSIEISTLRLPLKDRLRLPSCIVEIKAKLPSSKKQIALSSFSIFILFAVCNSRSSNSNSSMISLKVSKLFTFGFELITSFIEPEEMCLL